MQKRILAHVAIFSANVIYGINFTVAKEVIPEWMDPMALVICRILGASVLYWLLSYFYLHEKIEKKDFRILFLGGIFGVAVNQMLFLEGLSLTTPINASIIMTANPILVLILTAIILKETITGQKILGIVLGALGALLLILRSGEVSFTSDVFVGNILVFINALSYGVYLVIIKPMMKKYEPTTIIKWVFLFGFFTVIPFGTKSFLEVQWNIIPLPIYLAAGFVVFATTFLAYLFNIYGLKKLSPTTVSIYIYSQPVLASFVAIFAGKDSLNWIKIVSTLLVFIGVYLVSKKKKVIFKGKV